MKHRNERRIAFEGEVIVCALWFFEENERGN
jgi:hypothetical protein